MKKAKAKHTKAPGAQLVSLPAVSGPLVETAEAIRARRRLDIYRALTHLTIAESIILLTEIVREQIAADPGLNPAHIQALTGEMAALAAKLNAPDAIYLCSAAIDHIATQTLLANPSMNAST